MRRRNGNTGVQNSGKLLILGILALAVALAGAAWLFRYNATHRAAEFWGPRNAQLIRDAPRVLLTKSSVADSAVVRDISRRPGITHLRNALLEDRSFNWDQPVDAAPKGGGWKLTFDEPAGGAPVTILFTSDCCGAGASDTNGQYGRMISTAPIADGLLEVFTEYSSEMGAQPR